MTIKTPNGVAVYHLARPVIHLAIWTAPYQVCSYATTTDSPVTR